MPAKPDGAAVPEGRAADRLFTFAGRYVDRLTERDAGGG